MEDMGIGSKVKFNLTEDVVVVGRLKAMDEWRAVVVEEYAASIHGESTGCAGKVHAVEPDAVLPA